MLKSQRNRVRSALGALSIASLALLLSGCYEARTKISIGGDRISEGRTAESVEVSWVNSVVVPKDAWVYFAGYWFADNTGNRQEDDRNYYGGLELARELDVYTACEGLGSYNTQGFNPYGEFRHYTGGGPEKGLALGRGAAYVTLLSGEKKSGRESSEVTCKAQTGGYRLTNYDGEEVVLSGAVAVPDITGWPESYFVSLEWEDGWDLVETNGFRSPTDNKVKWKGQGGSRIEMNAVLRKSGDGELPIQRISSPLVLDGLNEDLLPVGPEEPGFSPGVDSAAASIEGQEVPEGYEVVLNSDGTVALVGQSSPTGPSWLDEALVYGAWTLLGAGALSGLLVGGIAIGRRAGR